MSDDHKSAWREALGYLRDITGRGAVAGTVGGPIDMADLVARYGVGDRTVANMGGVHSVPAPRVTDDAGAPLGGSEWLGQRMQDAGLVSSERNPVGEFLGGMAVSPELLAAKLGLAVKGAGPLMGGLGVIKQKGGNWLEGSIEDALNPLKVRSRTAGNSDPAAVLEEMRRTYPPERLEYMHPDTQRIVAQSLADLHPKVAINNWIDQKLGKYVRNEMATPEDPIRALAERGVLHVDPQQLNYRLDAYGKYPSPGQQFLGQSDSAKTWEGVTDNSVGSDRAGAILQDGDLGHNAEYLAGNPWLAKVPPETNVYGFFDRRNLTSDLGFDHLVDELRNSINPESGLPPELLLKYESLPKVTVPQAVERVAKINAWRAAQKAEADLARANNAATSLVKDYPEKGMRWVQLRQPTEGSVTGEQVFGAPRARGGANEADRILDGLFDTPGEEAAFRDTAASRQALADALKYEGDTMGHCVGGYCDDVASGASNIYSLRDAKGRPHVTIETSPGPREFDTGKPQGRPGNSPRIVQIKGKGNAKPHEDYIPFVQDFVRSQGPWTDVRDLENTGLFDFEAVRKGAPTQGLYEWTQRNPNNDFSLDRYQELLNAAAPSEQRYMTLDDMMKHLGYKTEGYAQGGSVRAADYDDAAVAERAAALAQELGL